MSGGEGLNLRSQEGNRGTKVINMAMSWVRRGAIASGLSGKVAAETL